MAPKKLDPEERKRRARAASDKWRRENRERVNARERERRSGNEEYKKRRKQKYREARREVLEAYGGECACCGETEIGFLTLDHVFNDGAEERRKYGSGISLMYALRRENFPRKDRYQVLCYNCNCGRHANGGVCPHHEENES